VCDDRAMPVVLALAAGSEGAMTTGEEAIEPTAFERTRTALESLTRAEIVERVSARISPEDAASFAVLSQGLSMEALRFLSARALLRAVVHEPPRPGAAEAHEQGARKP
jgi:hypothetical protein